MKKNFLIITIFLLLITYIYYCYISLLPDSIYMDPNLNYNFRCLPFINIQVTEEMYYDNKNNSIIEVSFLNKIPIKNINIIDIENIKIIPIGNIIGLKLYTNGVLIVGFSELKDKNNVTISSASNSDIKEGDIIISINDFEIDDIKTLKEVVSNSSGDILNLELLREGNIINTSIKPVEVSNKEYKLGLWVKDAATGVGTISFYEPESRMFAALGHGITDSDTNKLIDIDYGEVVTSKILTVKKSENGNPGEIRGTIINQNKIGEVLKNTNFGVYGILDDLTFLNINVEDTLNIAKRDEIEVGKAKIKCIVDDSNIAKYYEVEIQKIFLDNNYNNKSMQIKITDDELLNKTGGIVRGLSGAPIIQNGKFIGVITNVLVSKPEVGYAVFADIMIENLQK